MYNRDIVTTASNADPDLRCPGRFLMQQGIPEPPESGDAGYGRRIHRALALNNPEGLSAEEHDIFMSCQTIESRAIMEFFGPEAAIHLGTTREQPMVISVGEYEHGGTPDVVHRNGLKALICEYKTLSGEIEEGPTNQQLRDQVVLVDNTILFLDEIGVVKIQPLVTHHPQIVLYKREDIEQAWKELRERVIKSHDPKSPRVAGEVQCRYCKAKEKCPEYGAWAGGKLPVPRSIVDVPVAEWTPEQCAIFCEAKAAAAKWLENCETAIKKRLEKDPESVPGWYLKEGAEQDVLTDLEAIFNRFLARGGTQEAFMECLRGIRIKGKLVDALAEATQLRGKALKEATEQLLAGASEKKRNAPSLARKE